MVVELIKNTQMAFTPHLPNGRIDLSRPRWNQATFAGRLKHFASITNPRLGFVTQKTLEDAKLLVQQYKYVPLDCSYTSVNYNFQTANRSVAMKKKDEFIIKHSIQPKCFKNMHKTLFLQTKSRA